MAIISPPSSSVSINVPARRKYPFGAIPRELDLGLPEDHLALVSRLEKELDGLVACGESIEGRGAEWNGDLEAPVRGDIDRDVVRIDRVGPAVAQERRGGVQVGLDSLSVDLAGQSCRGRGRLRGGRTGGQEQRGGDHEQRTLDGFPLSQTWNLTERSCRDKGFRKSQWIAGNAGYQAAAPNGGKGPEGSR
jgi:hypothetical protein